MAQLATVLPNDHLAQATGGPTYSTIVFDGSTGVETRNKRWPTPRHAWNVTFRALTSDVQDIIDLFEDASGQHLSFLWSPPGYSQGDFRFATDVLQVTHNVSAVPGEYITTISASLIEVIDE